MSGPRRSKAIALALLFVVGCGHHSNSPQSQSQQDGVELIVTADRSTVRIAEPVTATVEITADASIDLGPVEPVTHEGGFVAVEVGDPESETVDTHRTRRQSFQFESYAAGRSVIPSFVVKYTVAGNSATAKNGRTLRSEPISVRVASSVGIFADPRKFRDNISVIDPPHGWVYWTIVSALIVVMVAALIASLIALARRLTLPSTPGETALRELDAVERHLLREHWSASQTIADVDAILRTFLRRFWKLPDDQPTVEELAWAAEGQPDLRDGECTAIQRLLRTADERKFAPLDVSPAEVARTIAETRALIIEMTRQLRLLRNHFGGRRRMFELSSPWVLLLLAGVPLVGWSLRRSGRRQAMPLSTASRAVQLSPTWRQRTMWIVPLLELIVLLLIIVALAQPRSGLTVREVDAEGVAIQLVIDRSGSMERDDFQLDGKWVTRLDAVKDVAGRFVSGDDTLSGRPSDLLGIIAFASHADAVSPLTIDHDFTRARLDQINFVTDFRDDGTAIGDALGLAVASLNEYDSGRRLAHVQTVPRKVIVLLTDGQQNIGKIDPLEAVGLAKAVDVKVHVIGIRPTGDGPQAIDGATGTLQQVADLTGGMFYLATNTQGLLEIYRQIDQLEKTNLGATRYSDYREWAIEPFRVRQFGFPPLILAALLLLTLKFALDRTLYRTLP